MCSLARLADVTHADGIDAKLREWHLWPETDIALVRMSMKFLMASVNLACWLQVEITPGQRVHSYMGMMDS
jgi:hypothetical protein